MTHFLLVVAHPSEQGLVTLMGQNMQKQIVEQGSTVEVLDLYRDSHTQDFSGRENATIAQTKLEYMQNLISRADQIVLAYPLWYGGPPAILKNWLDTNFTAHFAFVYHPASVWYKLSGLPVGSLKNKIVHQLVTCGSPAWRYALVLYPFALIIDLFIVRFTGMKPGWTKVWGNIALIPKEQRVAQIVDKHKVWFSKWIDTLKN